MAAVAGIAEGKASWKTGGGAKALAAIANPPVAPASLTVCLSFYSVTYILNFFWSVDRDWANFLCWLICVIAGWLLCFLLNIAKDAYHLDFGQIISSFQRKNSVNFAEIWGLLRELGEFSQVLFKSGALSELLVPDQWYVCCKEFNIGRDACSGIHMYIKKINWKQKIVCSYACIWVCGRVCAYTFISSFFVF